MTEKDRADCADRAFALRHIALRNAIYHVARRGWLDGWNRFYNLIVILGGTGSAADLARGKPELAFTLGAAIAAVGALQLVFDFSGRSRLHELLQRRYYTLMADIEETIEPTIEQCAGWGAEISRISADEPPIFRALDAIADNQATASLNGALRPRLKVSIVQSLTRQIFPHNGGTFPENKGWQAEPVQRLADTSL